MEKTLEATHKYENRFAARKLLQNELTRRISQNPRYSLRAFAKALNISPATLSLILSGKTQVSKKVLQKMKSVLVLDTKQLGELSSAQSAETIENYTSMDIFTVLSEWYHFAILSLLELKGSSDSPEWISKKLGISVTEVKLALQRMISLDMIIEKKGKLKQASEPIRFPGDAIPNGAAKRFQKQLILKAIESLENHPINERDVTSIMFATNSGKFETAVEKITNFRRSLCKEMENTKNPDSVYSLTIQLIPITKEKEK